MKGQESHTFWQVALKDTTTPCAKGQHQKTWSLICRALMSAPATCEGYHPQAQLVP